MRLVRRVLWLVLVIYVILLLPKWVASENFTVGFLINGNSEGLRISGAITYAIDEINKINLLNGHRLSVLYNNTKGDILLSTNSIIHQWNKGAIAIFGPEDSCETEATVAVSLNLAMISYKCSNPKLSDRKFYSTFARTYPPSTKILNSLFALLHYYSWRKFSVIYSDLEEYRTIFESLEIKSSQNNFTILHKMMYKKNNTDERFYSIFSETSKTTRVYVFIGPYRKVFFLMKAFYRTGLTKNGEHIVIFVDIRMYDIDQSYEYFILAGDPNNVFATEAAKFLLVVVSSPAKGPGYEKFVEMVRLYNQKPPFNLPELFPSYQKYVSMFAVYLYDAVMLYAEALSSILKEKGDPRNGTLVINNILSRKKYISIAGVEMRFDENGETEGNYSLLARYPKPDDFAQTVDISHIMAPVGMFYVNDITGETNLRQYNNIHWAKGDPPYDEPACGFDGRSCIEVNNGHIVTIVFATILTVVSVSAYIIYRNWKYEQEIAGLLWCINISEIEKCGFGGYVPSTSKTSLVSQMSTDSKAIYQIFTQTAMYKGTMLAIKELRFSKRTIDIPRSVKKEMKLMREMRHDNVNSFIGACVEPNAIYILTEYCSKGSLQDVLENHDLKLDKMFIASLVFDLLKAMIFLHDTELKIHGNLKSSNCVITSRWVLQVADFGLHYLRSNAENDSFAEHEYYRNLLWKAPEFLREPTKNPKGTQKGDMYAFGIILHEIMGRQGPFGDTELTPVDIVEKVKFEALNGREPYRPNIETLECQDFIIQAMYDAWHENPDARPDFRHIKNQLKKMKHGMKYNIMDNMMCMMEKYANNLEELVDERTALLVEEKKKTESLLHRMLPTSVAVQLIRGEAVIPESFDAVTIYFSDIVGFTEMSASSTPMEAIIKEIFKTKFLPRFQRLEQSSLFKVVTFLNDLYTLFDAIIANYDVYKVETIGDAYMVVSGLPIRNDDKHAGEISSMALELLDAIKSFKIRHRPNQMLKLRIGVHTGPVVAGVVGLTMPRYCLFGDTVNTASRMESNGEPLKIHISPWCKVALEKLGGYIIESRGLITMKGKAEMETFWLIGHLEGSKHRRDRYELMLPEPLFSGVLEKANSSEYPRRGSLATRVDNIPSTSNPDSGIVLNGSIYGPQTHLRFLHDSPRLCKRFCHHGLKDNKLRYRELEMRDEGSNSWSDIRNHSNDCKHVDCVQSTNANISQVENQSNTSPVISQNFYPIVEELNKNGLIATDDSLKPLLNCKAEISPSKEPCKRYLKGHLLKIPSKRWRSCDEIITFPKGSRSSLKDFFTKHINNRLTGNRTPTINLSTETIPKDESVV